MHDRHHHLITVGKQLFSERGYEGFSMRQFATRAKVSISLAYHYFPTKDLLLQSAFDETNTELGAQRALLPNQENTKELLRSRVRFQFEHAEDVVFVLKYYLHFRSDFEQNAHGYVPTKAYLHIEEVLRHGLVRNELRPLNVEEEAKVITHAINGFLLEYYPAIPTGNERDNLVNRITDFIWHSIERRAM